MAAKRCHRITLFKIPDQEDQEKLLNKYRSMRETAVKDGEPYILSIQAGPAFDDVRKQGYTIAVVSIFKSKEDMVYFDNECQAHQSLKALAKTLHKGAMVVFYESIFD